MSHNFIEFRPMPSKIPGVSTLTRVASRHTHIPGELLLDLEFLLVTGQTIGLTVKATQATALLPHPKLEQKIKELELNKNELIGQRDTAINNWMAGEEAQRSLRAEVYKLQHDYAQEKIKTHKLTQEKFEVEKHARAVECSATRVNKELETEKASHEKTRKTVESKTEDIKRRDAAWQKAYDEKQAEIKRLEGVCTSHWEAWQGMIKIAEAAQRDVQRLKLEKQMGFGFPIQKFWTPESGPNIYTTGNTTYVKQEAVDAAAEGCHAVGHIAPVSRPAKTNSLESRVEALEAGYRLLGKDELVQRGDEVLLIGGWEKSNNWPGHPCGANGKQGNVQYRRPLPKA